MSMTADPVQLVGFSMGIPALFVNPVYPNRVASYFNDSKSCQQTGMKIGYFFLKRYNAIFVLKTYDSIAGLES